MSTTTAPESSPKKYHFVVYAPDYTDAECLQRRMAVRERHLVNARGLLANGPLSEFQVSFIVSCFSRTHAFTSTLGFVCMTLDSVWWAVGHSRYLQHRKQENGRVGDDFRSREH